MQAYLLNINGFYIKTITLQAGNAVPPRVVFIAPPAPSGLLQPRWVGNAWQLANPADFASAPAPQPEPQPEPTPEPSLIPIVITSVTGTLTGFDDGPNQYTVAELTDVMATGTLAIPDSKFRVPFKRVDDNAVRYMVAEVTDGVFTLTINFKTGGKWVVNQELVNSAYPEQVFSIEPQTFMVI